MNGLNRIVVGCDCNRSTLHTLEQSRLTIGDLVHGDLPKSPSFVRPMIIGSATRPTDELTPQS